MGLTVTVLDNDIAIPDEMDDLPQFVVDEVVNHMKRYNEGAISIDTWLAHAGCALTVLGKTVISFEQYRRLKKDDAMSIKRAGAEVLKLMANIKTEDDEADTKNAPGPKKAAKKKKDDAGSN